MGGFRKEYPPPKSTLPLSSLGITRWMEIRVPGRHIIGAQQSSVESVSGELSAGQGEGGLRG